MGAIPFAAIVVAAVVVAIGAAERVGVIDASIRDLAIAVVIGGAGGVAIGRRSASQPPSV